MPVVSVVIVTVVITTVMEWLLQNNEVLVTVRFWLAFRSMTPTGCNGKPGSVDGGADVGVRRAAHEHRKPGGGVARVLPSVPGTVLDHRVARA